MIQIRNVPDEVHQALKIRAAKAGMSLSEFLLHEVTKVAETADARGRPRARRGSAAGWSSTRTRPRPSASCAVRCLDRGRRVGSRRSAPGSCAPMAARIAELDRRRAARRAASARRRGRARRAPQRVERPAARRARALGRWTIFRACRSSAIRTRLCCRARSSCATMRRSTMRCILRLPRLSAATFVTRDRRLAQVPGVAARVEVIA